ncbi:uncharacterized protein LOC121467809 [Drosophila elegans]|uniref:uncharacterized protein LOC121467809 n=1 Tax=Drosophila elegans TaxID=30023 RepID=UPI001BC85CC2|nr:uncharacterized protein LOC121467809 [Drosophila elegans]
MSKYFLRSKGKMVDRTPPSGNPRKEHQEGDDDSWNLPVASKVLPSEITSAVNVALAQAQETQRGGMMESISRSLQEEIRRGFMEVMIAVTEAMGPLKQQVELLQMQEVAKDGSDSRHSSRQDEKDRKSTGTNQKYSTGVPPASPHAQRSQSLDTKQYSAQNEPIQRSPRFEDGRALRQQAERESEGRFTRWGRVEKWEIYFDGDPNKMMVEDFVFWVEFLRRQSRCSWDEVLDSFHHLVRGKAAEWYWQFVRERPPEVWEDLKDEIVARGVGGEFERLRALHERRQRPGESVEDYFGAMRRLSTRLTQPMSEFEMIRVIKKGLAEDIARYVYAVRVRSMEQLREECLEVEDTFVRREPRPAYRPSQKFSSSGKRVEEIIPESESQDKKEDVIIEEAHLLTKQRICCWNCGQFDHVFRDCVAKEHRIFCYRCGKPEHFTPTFSNCSGNGRPSVTKAGEQRLGQKPAWK